MDAEAEVGRNDGAVDRRAARVHRRWFLASVALTMAAVAMVVTLLVRGTTEDRLLDAVAVSGAARDTSADWIRPDGTPVIAFILRDGSELDVRPPEGFESSWYGNDGLPSSYSGAWEGQRCTIGVTIIRGGEQFAPDGWDPAIEQRVMVEAFCPGEPVISF